MTDSIWFALNTPEDVSLSAVGGAMTVAVYVLVAVPPTESVTVYVTEGASPTNTGSGVNVITPVALTSNVPTPAMVTSLSATVQSTTPAVHESTTEVGSKVIAGSYVVSPTSKLTTCTEPFGPDVVSASATGGGGGVTVGVYVLVPVWFIESAIVYVTGFAVPTNEGKGSKVTTFVATSTVYVP